MKKVGLSPEFIGFLQTAGFLGYVGLVGTFFQNGQKWFGAAPKSVLEPMLFLSLFVFSAIVSGSIMLVYPFYVFWQKKDFKTAITIVAHSALWLFLFILFVCLFLAFRVKI